jgi:hypothetical protein
VCVCVELKRRRPVLEAVLAWILWGCNCCS